MTMRLIRVYSFPILLLLLFVTVGWDCNVVTSSDVQNNDDDTAATSTILEMQYVAARIRPSAAPFTKFPSAKASTEYPTNTPTTPYPTVSSYELYEIGIWPTRAPATPNPTTRYPTMYPTTINEEAYEITFTGTTDQEYMSVLPLNTFDVSIAVYEDLIPSSYINMPAFSLLNQETLIQDGWDVSQGILNQISYDSDKKIRVYRTSNGILAPGTIGLHQFQWSNGIIGSKTFTIEVTCSDGIKCNGDERYVYYRDHLTNYLNARCQGSPKPLCNDGNDCTADTCDEETGKCSFQRDSLLSTSECPLCSTEKCTPNCARKFCGPDSCGGSCGSDCTGTDEYCVVGKCQALAGEKGVCGRPYDLTKEFTSKKFKGIFDYTGNTAKGFSILRTYCNYQSESKELIYMFKMPQNSDYTGIDARVVPTTASGSANPVIQLIEVNPEEFPNPADGCLAVNTRRDLSAACNRKSTPPGNGGSRITWALKPGFVYYIQVESYWPGENNEGKFDLTIALTPGCTMQCDHKICGDSGCGKGFPCELNKALPSDSVCDESDERTRLLKKTCKPNCKKKQCGDDGCGGTCGECDSSKGDVCSITLGKCVTVGTCNHYKPRCTYKEKIKGKKMTIEGCPAVLAKYARYVDVACVKSRTIRI